MSVHSPIPRPSNDAVLPLQHGDRLTREEFERRYDATPGLRKAELIDGRVYMPPPVSHADHSGPQFLLMAWMGWYVARTPGVVGGDNGSLRLDLDNMPQPDGYLLLPASAGGQSHVGKTGYLESAPELVVEVAASSASYDLHDKLQLYRRHGVREYIVWRTRNGQFDYNVLREGNYTLLSPETPNRFKSEIFPGLWLDAAALMDGNLAAALDYLQQGLATPEHAAFVAKLSAAARP